MSWISRVTNSFRGESLDRDLEEELQYHVAARTAQFARAGADPAEAARIAPRRMGNQLAIREESRDARLVPWLESLLRDTRFGARILMREPGVTVTAVVSLGLAIGACAAAFALIDALILRPLPVPQPSRLISLAYPTLRAMPGFPPDNDHFSYPELQGFREAAGRQVDLFGATVWGGPVRATFDTGASAAPPEQVRAQWISADGLAILGIRPAIGRLFVAADDARDQKQSVAVISHGFWMSRFAGSPSVLGRGFTLRGISYRIVGVAGEGFSGMEPGVFNDVWLPLMTSAPGAALMNWSSDRFAIFGRLKPGIDVEAVRDPLEIMFSHFRRMEANDPESHLSREQVERFVNVRLKINSSAQGHISFLRWQFERPLWILAVVVGLVLLVACSNVANLMMARAASRSREMTMRMALGAGRLRLVQQVLMECVVLAALGSVVGFGIAVWTAPALVSLMGTAADPAFLDVTPGWRMLAFLAAVCLGTTTLFGLVPALRASVGSAAAALKEAGAHLTPRSGALRAVLAAQVGFSFMVLFVAGLLLLSFHRLTSVNLGFSQKNVLLFDVDAGKSISSGARARALQGELLDRLRHVAGVEAAATSGMALMGGATSPIRSAPVRVAGRPPAKARPQFFSVSPGFFAAMQIPLAGGRDFTRADGEPEIPQTVIVNQLFARLYFPGQNALGQRIERVVDDEGHFAAQEIVGVVGDAKYNNLREPPLPTIYVPFSGMGGVVEVRTRQNPAPLAPALRRAIQGLDPALTVMSVTSQAEHTDDSILQERMLALLGGFFALIALVLAGVGLRGVLGYSIVRRTREIGMRVALGATLAAVVRMVTTEVATALGIGMAAGLAGGFALSKLVMSSLFEVKPADFGSVALPILCLLAVCAASALPLAVRAARIDPAEALRQQ